MISARTLSLALLVAGVAGTDALANSLVATRTVPARTILQATDVALVDAQVGGAHQRVEDVVGLETRVTLYVGRPVQVGDVGPAALVERNETVLLRYRTGALVIETDGRALDRAAAGQTVRVMNLGSRQVVVGRVNGSGLVEVGQ